MSSLPETSFIDTHQFNGKALEMFHDQAVNVPVYASFLRHIGIDHMQVTQVDDIPFLPIGLFKNHRVLRTGILPERTFTSSGTGDTGQSCHEVGSLAHYEAISKIGFELQYGDINDWEIFALLPSYLERAGSSLIHMVDHWIRSSKYNGGFYLYEHGKLFKDLIHSAAPKKLLIGVSYALLDLADEGYMLNDVKDLTVMETGGMKGRRKEMTRSELHSLLMSGLGVQEIHSEYGMTELLSQAYAGGNGIFSCPSWMQVRIRAVDDPFTLTREGKTGGINVIDLANRDSCAFIATDDLGRSAKNGTFEVLGRFDHSDTRGCNLLVVK